MTKEKIKTPMDQVLEYYPDAKSILRPTGKPYRQIKTNDGRILGQGKTGKQAWKAAARNLNN